MTDFLPQSTNQLPGDTSQSTRRVLVQDKVAIAFSGNGLHQVTVSLPLGVPTSVDAWIGLAGSGLGGKITGYNKMPYYNDPNAGFTEEMASLQISQIPKSFTNFQVTFSFYTKITTYLNAIVFYTIYSDLVNPTGYLT